MGTLSYLIITRPDIVFALSVVSQSLRAWFGRFAFVVRDFDLYRSQVDHSVFWQQYQKKRLLLVMYVNIIITGGNTQGRSTTCRNIFR